jgi:hypothetical protein
MVLSTPLALAAGASAGGARMVAALRRSRRDGSRRPDRRGKCDPATDTSVGHVLTHLTGLPVTLLDTSILQRVHFWRTRTSEQALTNRLAVLHGAKQWDSHFRWAACPTRTADIAPSFKCRGLVAWARALPSHHGMTDADAFLAGRFSNWTMCHANEGHGRLDRQTTLTAELQTPWLCNASERALLRRCGVSAAYRRRF